MDNGDYQFDSDSVQDMKKVLYEIAKRRKLDSYIDLLNEYEKNLTINIAFLGEFKSGKSTLLNALLGEDLLPAFDEPTTAVVTEIQSSDKESYSVLDKDNKWRSISKSELSYYITDTMNTKKVLIKLPSNGVLNYNFAFIDTPGINSLINIHDDITYGYLPFVDAAIIAIDSNYGSIPRSLLDFLKSKFTEEFLSKIIFVITKMDTIPDKSIDRVKQSFVDSIKKYFPSEHIVFTSAVLALDGKTKQQSNKTEKSNIYKLENLILNKIVRKKEQYEKEKLIKKIKEIGGAILNTLNYEIKAFSWETEELDNNIKKLGDEINEYKIKVGEIKREFNETLDKTKDYLQHLIEISIPPIIAKKFSGGNIDYELNDFSNEIIKIIANNMEALNGKITKPSNNDDLHDKQHKIENVIKNIIPSLDSIMKSSEIISKFVTIVTLLIITSTTGGKLTTPEEIFNFVVDYAILRDNKKIPDKKSKGKNGKNEESFSQNFDLLDKIKDINPVDFISSQIAQIIAKKNMQEYLIQKLGSEVDLIFETVCNHVLQDIQKEFIIPLSERKKILEKLKTETLEEKKKEFHSIENDIKVLSSLVGNRRSYDEK